MIDTIFTAFAILLVAMPASTITLIAIPALLISWGAVKLHRRRLR